MKQKSIILRSLVITVFIGGAVCGCAGSGQPKYQSEKYILNYQPPVFEKMKRVDETIRFSRFTVKAGYNTTNMIFQPDDYKLDSFNYHRWAVNPADMTADNLLRDMQISGLFRAVFPRYAVEDGRYILQGGVEEFFLRVTKNDKFAVIGLTITLKDYRQKDSLKQIIFQKNYRHEQLLTEASPHGYCQAMSKALQSVSQFITTDTYEAIKTATKE